MGEANLESILLRKRLLGRQVTCVLWVACRLLLIRVRAIPHNNAALVVDVHVEIRIVCLESFARLMLNLKLG